MLLLKGTKIQSLDNQINKNPSLIPKLPFTLYASAGKGSGKSLVLLNLILSKDLLANKFNQIYVINPTAKLDQKWDSIKNVPGILNINTRLINLMKKNNKTIKVMDFSNETDYEGNSVISDENFIEDFNLDFLKELIEEQTQIIKKYGKENADTILLIFDDTISNNYWKSELMSKMIFNSRHFKISICITSQSYKSLPKKLRLNMSLLLLFYTANEQELKTIYEENSASTSFKQFNKVYNQITSKSFNFITINYQNDKQHILQDAFQSFV